MNAQVQAAPVAAAAAETAEQVLATSATPVQLPSVFSEELRWKTAAAVGAGIAVGIVGTLAYQYFTGSSSAEALPAAA